MQKSESTTKEEDKPTLVSICCATYNHSNYIKECLNGFLMQKTNFKYEILIHDDASTDDTDKIIKEYEALNPNIIKPIYQIENKYSKGISISATYNFPRARGKYIAICEGDDYWTDPLKLQKQVDFLENNPNCDLVYTQVKQYKENRKRFLSDSFGGPFEKFSDLLKRNTIPSLTVLLKKSVIVNYLNDIRPEKQKWVLGDYPIWLYVALKGKIHFLPEVSGVYRILTESASHSKDFEKIKNLINSEFEMKRYFQKLGSDLDKSLDLNDLENYCLLRQSLIYNNFNGYEFFKKIKNKKLNHLIYLMPKRAAIIVIKLSLILKKIFL